MIGFLKGTVEIKERGYVYLDVNGVGYKVLVSNDLYSRLTLQEKITLFIYTHIREDAFDLFGFGTSEDLALFELLLSVSGIGPKTAIGVFSLGKSSAIIHAIQNADLAFFEGVPRLGKKNAQKIIIELKNKVGAAIDLDISDDTESHTEELLQALMGFGFSKQEAYTAVRQLQGKGDSVEEKVKLALKYLGK